MLQLTDFKIVLSLLFKDSYKNSCPKTQKRSPSMPCLLLVLSPWSYSWKVDSLSWGVDQLAVLRHMQSCPTVTPKLVRSQALCPGKPLKWV
jgi:hypothetical protein